MAQLKFNSDGTIEIPETIKKDIEQQWHKQKQHKPLDIWDEKDNLEDDKTYNLEDDTNNFNLYKENKKLSPLKFSNNKSQEDITNEVLNAIQQGKKFIFIRGVCGTGKSVIALNIAKKLGKTSIVVPGKALQKQYQDDYSNKCYVLKNNHKKLKIKVITGRQNHICPFYKNCTSDDSKLPCKIEIKEANIEQLRQYLKENPKVENNLELKNIRRTSIAPVCPYWSPIIPSEFDFPLKSEKRKYQGLKGINFTIHNRKKGCKYYNQFNSYLDAEVIVFNSAKYKLEALMNRKPHTEVEIIDECDEFLDSFSNIKKINISRLSNSLNNIFPNDETAIYVLEKIQDKVIQILKDNEVRELADTNQIKELSSTQIHELFNLFLNNSNFIDAVDEDSYVQTVYESIKTFEEFIDESYVQFSIEEKGLNVSIVTTNLEKKFAELAKKTNIIVMMSGTIHSEQILKYIFGLDDFIIIDAETINQGEIETKKTGAEIDCKYSNFKSGQFTREQYLKALDKSIEQSIKPTLVHVNAFEDLPSEQEKFTFNLNNLMTKQKLRELQDKDKNQKQVIKFKKKQIPVLFTTKCNRGVDFPKEQCNSIVFTKYPNPNVKGLFWQILNKTHPQYYWTFYQDKAKREFLQKLYRGVRSHDDHIYILSPDLRVLQEVDKLNQTTLQTTNNS